MVVEGESVKSDGRRVALATEISEGRGIIEKNLWRRFLAEARRRRGEGDKGDWIFTAEIRVKRSEWRR
jgi:hypothetical protein